jgi:hypothetical protein
MAKKKITGLSDALIRKTEDAPAQPETEKDLVKPRGIGLKDSEWRQLDAIGAELASNAHALAAWAIRDFIRRYESGELPTRTETKTTLPGLD